MKLFGIIFFIFQCIATIPDFNYCSWHSKAYGNTTDEADIKWHSKLSSLSDQFWHLCWDTDICGFHSPGQPTFSLPGRIAPEQKRVFTFHCGFISSTFKTQFQIALRSSAQVSPANARERNVELATDTHVHTKHRQSCVALEEAYLSLAHSHEGTMAKLKPIGHVVC